MVFSSFTVTPILWLLSLCGHDVRLSYYLGHELICYSLMVLKADLACSQRPLQEESKRQLSKLGLDKCTDGLVGEGKDLLTLLFPLVILRTDTFGII